MYRAIAYLKFLITATNQHGVHSPFVYRFITQGIYRPKKSVFKSGDVLLKSIDFFKVDTVKIAARHSTLRACIQEHYPSVRMQEEDGPIIQYYENPGALDAIDMTLANRHNDTMIIIDAIHKNRENSTFWKQLTEHSKITVSIDFFYCGALFFRKEQVKEHFKIRI
ncbi:hypothetical protein [Spongiimicrobium salis]|uniref:hypothetical protein n=1 Tax=Spongiimicrobium salis TaxID=1667022 RepID=UPI00374CDAA5